MDQKEMTVTVSGRHPFNGEVAEVLVYAGALSNQGLIQVELYLANKYGVTLAPVDRDNDGLPDLWEMV